MDNFFDSINSFNPFKILYHSDKLKEIVSGAIPTPVLIEVDPSNFCNHSCFFCNSKFIRRNKEHMSHTHYSEILENISEWNSVKTVLFAGGGEPFANPEFGNFLSTTVNTYGMNCSVMTNASLMHTAFDKLQFLDFISISFEASNSELYRKIRNTDTFHQTIKNIKYVVKNRKEKYPNLKDITIKILVTQLNYNDIYNTAKLAKEMGVNGVYIRPAGFNRIINFDGTIDKTLNEDLSMRRNIITEEIQKTQELQSDNFSIAVSHSQFTKDYTPSLTFKKCRVTPTSLIFGADENMYICFEHRGNSEMCLGSHKNPKNILSLWGSQKHKEMIEKIVPSNCNRCARNGYNTLIEEVFINDKMCRNYL